MRNDEAAATSLGAVDLGERRCRFRLWAPLAEEVELHLGSPADRAISMTPGERGYFEAVAESVPPGSRYRYRLDGEAREYADPASRFQPEGVHGPSEVVSRHFDWTDDAWRGIPLRDYVLYELHVGTFTEEGTFDAIIERLDELRDLGITSLELMPVAEFPGGRNWGYDGVFPFAVQSSYGGPQGLKRLVDACHRRGLAITLDVVYNHLGPEGNLFSRFGPYFTDRYRTPWGPAINFDGAESDEVRRFFVDNALYWLEEFHVDALRLDAVHAISDQSPRTFLEELARTVEERFENRPRRLFPESSANDARLVERREAGGIGLDAVWNDDFHHALRTLLTDDRSGYFEDYGSLALLEKAFREGFAYSGEYSRYRRRRHGISSKDVPAERFIVFSQNHDQIGNRPLGDRPSTSLELPKLELAAAAVLLSPYLPLLFMGEEYGETARFPYFVSHSDPALIEAVRVGRQKEFSRFDWKEQPPDPQDERTFRSAFLRRAGNPSLRAFYERLLRLRRELPALRQRSKEHMKVVRHERASVLEVHYWTRKPVPEQTLALFHFGSEQVQVEVALLRGLWRKRLDSESSELGGIGSTTLDRLRGRDVTLITLPPWSVVLYEWDSTSEAA